MKRALVFVAACAPETDLPWRLDRDRVVAVRAEPAHITPGEIARFDALLAHGGGPTTVEPPAFASAPASSLFDIVHFNVDHWEVIAPDETRLASARAELGLAADAPVPLEVTLEFAGRLLATKIVWLGDRHANPGAPPLAVSDPLPLDRDIALAVDTTSTVRWLTSCGTLRGAETAQATLVVDEPCAGEIALVLRDGLGGVAWRVVPIRAE